MTGSPIKADAITNATYIIESLGVGKTEKSSALSSVGILRSISDMPSADFYRNLLYYLLAEIRYYLRLEHNPDTIEEVRKQAREDIKEAVRIVTDKVR